MQANSPAVLAQVDPARPQGKGLPVAVTAIVAGPVKVRSSLAAMNSESLSGNRKRSVVESMRSSASGLPAPFTVTQVALATSGNAAQLAVSTPAQFVASATTL